ncbi:MAG: hypothetical protein VZS44_04910 [Bacilli bacterium]|nr:hypothetical protein [Bacilli bacterium]
MYMDDYYNEQIEKYEKDRAIAALGMEVSLSFVNFKNDKQKQKLREEIRKMQGEELSKAGKIRKKIINEINSLKSSSSYVSTLKVDEVIRNTESRYKISLDYSEKSDMSLDISTDSLKALEKYITDYINAKRNIEQAKQQLEHSKKNSREQQGRTTTNSTKVSSGSTYNNKPTGSYGYTTTIPKTANQPNKPFNATTNEERKKLIKQKIAERIKNQSGIYGIDYEEKQVIKELYPEFNGYDEYFSIDILDKGIIINKISNQKNISTQKMMEVGLTILKVVTQQLLHDHRVDQPELFHELGMKNTFEKYKPIYDKYMKWYKSLKPAEKAKVDREIAQDDVYTRTFGETIATPEQLKNKINIAVKNNIVNDAFNYYHANDMGIIDFYTKTMHASRYMSIDDIASLYNSLKEKYEGFGIYPRNEEDKIRLQKQKDEQLEKLQTDFAKVILSRLEEHSKSVDIEKMTEEQKHLYFEKEHKKLAAICLEVLKEEPITETLNDITTKEESKENKESIMNTYKVKEEARTRIYGLSKVQKALAQLTGKWQRYTELMEKPELNKHEQEELKGMFR